MKILRHLAPGWGERVLATGMAVLGSAMIFYGDSFWHVLGAGFVFIMAMQAITDDMITRRTGRDEDADPDPLIGG